MYGGNNNKGSEVMWPKLVANKILKKKLGSNNFVADFPTNNKQTFLPSDNFINDQQKTSHTYKVFVSTWNVGGIAPNDELDMEELLEMGNTYSDIYVLGFQEIVPLRASNVFGSENNKVSGKWNSLIRKTLNKRSKYSENSNSGQEEFMCVISKQMVGIFISVWVQKDVLSHVQHPSVSCVGCGIMGCLGNKGSVSIRFLLDETSFCFVCSHLASGGKESDEKQRNSDVYEILSRSTFSSDHNSLGLPKHILDHDRVILLGDLNYRISLPEETTRLLVDKEDWNTLLNNDQLKMEFMDGRLFQNWHEGIINFSPTYKYFLNSDVYYGCLQSQKHGKKRSPAWCDRIIWMGKGLKQELYTRSESKLSDHRPVKAIFTAEVPILSSPTQLQNLFSSETTHLTENSSTDRFFM